MSNYNSGITNIAADTNASGVADPSYNSNNHNSIANKSRTEAYHYKKTARHQQYYASSTCYCTTQEDDYYDDEEEDEEEYDRDYYHCCSIDACDVEECVNDGDERQQQQQQQFNTECHDEHDGNGQRHPQSYCNSVEGYCCYWCCYCCHNPACQQMEEEDYGRNHAASAGELFYDNNYSSIECDQQQGCHQEEYNCCSVGRWYDDQPPFLGDKEKEEEEVVLTSTSTIGHGYNRPPYYTASDDTSSSQHYTPNMYYYCCDDSSYHMEDVYDNEFTRYYYYDNEMAEATGDSDNGVNNITTADLNVNDNYARVFGKDFRLSPMIFLKPS